jgi:uncharacterized protein with FMN-binding domain
MRRAPLVLAATVLGTTGVLMFEPREVTPDIASSTSSASTSQEATVEESAGTTVATGAPISTRYGTAQVRVTIESGKITEVEALQIPSNDSRSVQISNDALPALRESALTKQSAVIDSVSGATYTSQGYAASLQSALDKAKFTAPDGSTAPTTAPSEPADGGHGGRGGRFGLFGG